MSDLHKINEMLVSDRLMTSREPSYLTVIIPAYNEGEHILDNLLYTSQTISKFVKNYQILAVNDGSSDNTLEMIKTAADRDSGIAYISYEKNHGKGYAIRTGVNCAEAEFIAFLDADLELNPTMLRYFLKALNTIDADIAIGSKMHKDSRLDYPISRKVISIGYFLLLKLLFNLNLKDTQTGIKLFKGQVIKPICADLYTDGFAFDIEILATASKMGYKILELPITLKYSRSKRGKEKSKVSIRQIFRVFRDTLRIKKILKKKTT